MTIFPRLLRPPGRAGRRRLFVGGAALLCALCASCGSSTASSASAPTSVAPASIGDPLATSLSADGATWATVPMGHLGDTLNTFWQLFVLPAGSSTWELRTPSGIATNGGLVIGGTTSRLLTGILPANLLRFSTVEVTSDRGVSWATGVPPSALAASPDSLTAAGATGADALLAGSGGRMVSESGNLSAWSPVTDAEDLSGRPALHACKVTAITALGTGTGTGELIGAACSHRGVAGILERTGSVWRLDAPRLPNSLATSPVTVLRLIPTDTGVAALLAARTDGGTTLVSTRDTGGAWSTSALLRLAPSQPLLATGPDASGGLWVLTDRSDPELSVADPGRPWTRLPAPPASTQTVAFLPPTAGAAAGVDAFVVNGAVLSVWHLAPGAVNWSDTQKITVPIQYGSSGE